MGASRASRAQMLGRQGSSGQGGGSAVAHCSLSCRHGHLAPELGVPLRLSLEWIRKTEVSIRREKRKAGEDSGAPSNWQYVSHSTGSILVLSVSRFPSEPSPHSSPLPTTPHQAATAPCSQIPLRLGKTGQWDSSQDWPMST